MELASPPKEPIEFVNIAADEEGLEVSREFFIDWFSPYQPDGSSMWESAFWSRMQRDN